MSSNKKTDLKISPVHLASADSLYRIFKHQACVLSFRRFQCLKLGLCFVLQLSTRSDFCLSLHVMLWVLSYGFHDDVGPLKGVLCSLSYAFHFSSSYTFGSLWNLGDYILYLDLLSRWATSFSVAKSSVLLKRHFNFHYSISK